MNVSWALYKLGKCRERIARKLLRICPGQSEEEGGSFALIRFSA